MARQPIILGLAPTGAGGDTLRQANGKINEMMQEIYAATDDYGSRIASLEASEAVRSVAGLTPDQNGDVAAAGLVVALGVPQTAADIGAATAAQGATADSALQPDDIAPAIIKDIYESNADTNAFTDLEKAKLAGIEGTHFRGTFLDLAALQASVSDPNPGDYADVDGGVGQPVSRFIWDADDTAWVLQGGSGGTVTAAEVKTLYESNPDTNAFTNAEKSKLGGVAAGATANATNAELRDRATHTGAQAISTVTNLPEEIARLTFSSIGVDGTTDFDTILTPGPWPRLLGGAPGARNPNHPDGQTERLTDNGVSNHYWLDVKAHASNRMQVAYPYLSSSDVTRATIKFRFLNNVTWTPWVSVIRSDVVTTALAGKEPTIPSGTNAQYVAGDKTIRNFGDNVRAQLLTSLPTPTNVTIAATDAFLAAMAKLQGQVTARMANPMTTAGDLIVGGASGAPARVALGAEGTMLIAGASAASYGNNPRLAGYSELMETMANNAIDVSTSNVKKRVLTANATFTISGAVAGRVSSFTLLLEAGASYTVAWPASFKWIGGVPGLTAKDVITGFSVDGGAQWIVSYPGSYA